MNVPTEIFDYIISLLQSDKAALRACCESHTILSHLAKSYLYANIHLGRKNDGNLPPEFSSPSDFSNHLSENPYVVQYIHGLDIQFVAHSQPKMNQQLKQTAAILPILSSLRTISFDLIPPYDYPWKSIPETFRRAFLNCLRSPSMQEVSISRFVDFPFMYVLSGACKKITRLAVSRTFKSHAIYTNLDDTPYLNQNHTFESLCISSCDNQFLSMLIDQIEQHGLQFRSLEFTPLNFQSFHIFSRLFAGSSNSLMKLDLAIDAINPPVRYGDMILGTLSTLPHLERFIIRAKLEYNSQSGEVLLSPISHLKQLFIPDFSSDHPTSSLKHVTLDFKCIMQGQIPSFSFSKDFGSPLVELLSSISTFAESTLSNPIRVDLCLRGSDRHDNSSEPNWKTVPMPLHFLLSPLYQCGELMEFVSRGMLSVKPVYS